MRPNKPTVGPLGRTRWNKKAGCWTLELSAEGTREFEKCLEKHPNPEYFLQRAYPTTFFLAKAAIDSLHEAAVEGVWKGLAYWDPKRGAKSTCIAYWIRAEVQKEMRMAHNKLGKCAELSCTIPSRGPDPADVAVSLEDQQRVRKAVGKLPELERQIIEDVFRGGLSARQASALRGKSSSWGSLKCRNALGMIRQSLEA